jgi:fimbrial chaperone protein
MKPTSIKRLSRVAAAATLATALCVPAPVMAGAFTVTPVRIYMSPRDRAVAVTVTNDADSEVVLQADLHTWTQKSDGRDELVLTDDLILSPPILKLAPKARQVVRLARLIPPDMSRQLTYRFILREVPEVKKSTATVQIPIALALSMPVFITPPGAKREIGCGLAGVEGTSIGMRCGNTGSAYAQIREIEITRGEQKIARFEGGAYILPGASKTIAVGVTSTVTPGAARAVVTFDDNKTQEFQITLQ